MKIIGVTGGVGAGKSSVLNTLKEICNCEIIMADDVAKEIMKFDGPLTDIAKELFGDDAYVLGELNKKLIASVIYSNEDIRKAWENAVHPATNAAILEKIKAAGDRQFVFIEAALLIENGYEKICDEIWYVYADEKTRRERLKTERHYEDNRINGIFNGQLSEEEFKKHCSFMINTCGSFDNTRKQLLNKLEEYRE